MQNKQKQSLAQFIVQRREKLNLSQVQLAQNSGLKIEEIISIEQGYESFLATTTRQKLAHALKLENKDIKRFEKSIDLNITKKDKMDEIREQILLNSHNPDYEIECPVCGEKLITRIARMYDLEDNLVLRPKARCSKCPFQLID